MRTKGSSRPINLLVSERPAKIENTMSARHNGTNEMIIIITTLATNHRKLHFLMFRI